jgi:hypothetical protein
VTVRTASCQCWQPSIQTSRDPVRISVCHCLACQRRSGSAFAVQARFDAAAATFNGQSSSWTRFADSGAPTVHHFCPQCGSTVWYHSHLIAIPVGAFADPGFPASAFSVYEARRHRWVAIVGDEIEHHD